MSIAIFAALELQRANGEVIYITSNTMSRLDVLDAGELIEFAHQIEHSIPVWLTGGLNKLAKEYREYCLSRGVRVPYVA